MTLLPDSYEEHTPQFSEEADGLQDSGLEFPESPQEISDAGPPEINIEDLTVAQAIGQLFRAPGETLRALGAVVAVSNNPTSRPAGLTTPFTPRLAKTAAAQPDNVAVATPLSEAERATRQREALQLGVRLLALIVTGYGSSIMLADRTELFGLNGGLAYFLAGFLLWIAGDIYGSWPSLRGWWRGRGTMMEKAAVRSDDFNTAQVDESSLLRRLMIAGAALLMSSLTLAFTSGNKFTVMSFITWPISIGLWIAVFAPAGWGLRSATDAVRRVRLPGKWTLLALVVIMVIATLFRLNDLNGVPSEMTSDHVEKILDAQRILDGNPQVFFPNNGGREPLQFYTMSLLSLLPGLGLNFFTLKLLTALEGLITIPVLWWMGREMIGEDEPDLGNAVGLALAALVAVSYWHVMLSRLGLRIVLTVLVTGLLIIFFSRALRYNRRGDFIKVGLVLGFGLYAYQAVRMLPVVVVLGVGLAMVFGLFRRRAQLGRYVTHLVVLIAISVAVFVPLLGFWFQYPDDFLRRTSGRLFGDDLIQTTNEQGELIERIPTAEEQMTAFQNNIGILLSNIRNALLMYNWKGDVAWITAVPNTPTLDMFSGSLLIVGLGAWLVRMVRRRDAIDWLMPPMVFIMLLPSALSIAYPIENPSATRTSGTLPEIYLFAALPLALLWVTFRKLFPGVRGTLAGAGVTGFILVASLGANWNTYFVDFRQTYTHSSPAPYSEAGRFLRGFAESGGSLGNAYMIAYPYWWDHRALGIEADVTDWPNGIERLADVPNFLYLAWQKSDRYRFDPAKDILFFFSLEDIETEASLKEWFPTGYEQLVTSYKAGDDFMTYRVPAPGTEGFNDFLRKTDQIQ